MSGEFPSSTGPPGGVSPGLHDPQRQRSRGVKQGGRSETKERRCWRPMVARGIALLASKKVLACARRDAASSGLKIATDQSLLSVLDGRID
jgi:hypothetical protein